MHILQLPFLAPRWKNNDQSNFPAVNNKTGGGGNMKQFHLGNGQQALKTVIPERGETHKVIPLIALPSA